MSLQVQKTKGSSAVIISDVEIEVLEQNIPVKPTKMNKFLQPACFLRLSKSDSVQPKNPSVLASHGRGQARGRGFTPPHFQQPVQVQKPPTAAIHGQSNGRMRGRGAAQTQMKTPYQPPPVKKPQQQAPLPVQVKMAGRRNQGMHQDFDPQLKEQLIAFQLLILHHLCLC